ncbi:MAG: hypothetical protein JJLCMIEE_00861 [Acidimicrobiales bacterium]|nr:MAG: glyoxalase [Actinomycetota bacterium]MBV6507803.1 hypothetical protein [Acidimicrobiales bacterium]RIK05961.1 MAG: glyoxalase [Acidobacteriota bacterium]
MTPVLDTLTVGDSPEAWARAGFRVESGCCRIASLRIDLSGRAAGGGIRSWGLRHLSDAVTGAAIDGLPTDVSTSDTAIAGASHPNGVSGVDHLVVATPDCGRTVAALEAAGFEPRRGRLSKSHGTPLRQVFFWAGPTILEVIGPEEPAGDGPASFFGLALVAEDLDFTAAWFGDRIGRPKQAVQPGRRIATLRHKEIGISIPLAVMSPHGSLPGSPPQVTG